MVAKPDLFQWWKRPRDSGHRLKRRSGISEGTVKNHLSIILSKLSILLRDHPACDDIFANHSSHSGHRQPV